MRAFLAGAMMGILGVSGVALADTWRAKAELEPGAPAACRQADVSKLVFDFAETSSELSGKTSGGHDFRAPVAADGSISTTIKVPVGAKEFVVDLVGNAKSRELQAFNKEYSCRFNLLPMQ